MEPCVFLFSDERQEQVRPDTQMQEVVPAIHAVASLFPAMTEEEYRQLVADIREAGLREPIWLADSQVIDGRQRLRACQELDIAPRYREWDGQGSLVAFVVSCNLHRRHLTSSQKAIVALEVERVLAREAKQHMIAGGGEKRAGLEIVPNPPVVALHAAREAASMMGTNAHYVTDAKRLVAQAPELQLVVHDGTLTIPEAKTLATLSQPQRAEALHLLSTGAVKTAKGAVLEIKKAAQEAQVQAAPDRPEIVRACWQEWLPAQSPCDLLLTDPPYSTEIAEIETFAQTWLPQALAKVRSTGRAFVFIGNYPRELLAYQQVRTPWPLQQILVWHYKNTLGPAPRLDYKQSCQLILVFRGPDAPALQSACLTELWDVQEVNAPDGRLGNRYHTWQKPDALAERLIRQSTRPGDLVLDCFAGTGTFLLAAHRLGRVAGGCECSTEMLALAQRRGCIPVELHLAQSLSSEKMPDVQRETVGLPPRMSELSSWTEKRREHDGGETQHSDHAVCQS